MRYLTGFSCTAALRCGCFALGAVIGLAGCGGDDGMPIDAGQDRLDGAHEGDAGPTIVDAAPRDGAIAPDGGEPFTPCVAPPAYDDVGIQVSPSGSDESGDGTEASPYRTIGHVLAEVAEAGDTIILREGEYPEPVRIRIPNITIRSHTGEWGVISQPISIDGDAGTHPVMFDVDSDGSKLQRVEVRGGFYGVFLQTRFGWGDPDTLGATNITIEDCRIHDTGRDCIKVTPQSDGLVVRRTEIWNSGMGYPEGTPPDDKNAEGIDAVNADDILIQDCYIHDTATTGVYLKGGSTGGVIERTRVERTGGLGIALGFDTSLEFFDTETNPGHYENIRGTVANCIVRDTRYAGIALYASRDARVINNTIIDTAVAGHAPLYFGIPLQDWDPSGGRPANLNPTLLNNLVFQSTPGDCVAIRHFYDDELGTVDGLEGAVHMDHNLYAAAGGSCTFTDGREGGIDGASLEAWRAHIDAEASSRTEDPLLTSDGHIQAGSAAIDAAQTDGAPSTDIDCEPRSGAVDIGADEL